MTTKSVCIITRKAKSRRSVIIRDLCFWVVVPPGPGDPYVGFLIAKNDGCWGYYTVQLILPVNSHVLNIEIKMKQHGK